MKKSIEVDPSTLDNLFGAELGPWEFHKRGGRLYNRWERQRRLLLPVDCEVEYVAPETEKKAHTVVHDKSDRRLIIGETSIESGITAAVAKLQVTDMIHSSQSVFNRLNHSPRSGRGLTRYFGVSASFGYSPPPIPPSAGNWVRTGDGSFAYGDLLSTFELEVINGSPENSGFRIADFVADRFFEVVGQLEELKLAAPEMT